MIFGKIDLIKNIIFSNDFPEITKEVLCVSKEWDSHIIITGKYGIENTTLLQSITENNSILEHTDIHKKFNYSLQNNGYIGLDKLQIYPIERVNDFIDLAYKMNLKMVWVVEDQILLSKDVQDLIEELNFIQILIE